MEDKPAALEGAEPRPPEVCISELGTTWSPGPPEECRHVHSFSSSVSPALPATVTLARLLQESQELLQTQGQGQRDHKAAAGPLLPQHWPVQAPTSLLGHPTTCASPQIPRSLCAPAGSHQSADPLAKLGFWPPLRAYPLGSLPQALPASGVWHASCAPQCTTGPLHFLPWSPLLAELTRPRGNLGAGPAHAEKHYHLADEGEGSTQLGATFRPQISQAARGRRTRRASPLPPSVPRPATPGSCPRPCKSLGNTCSLLLSTLCPGGSAGARACWPLPQS